MKTGFLFCFRQGYALLTIALLLAGGSVFSALKLRMAVSDDGLIPKNSPQLALYESVTAKFGTDQVALVFVKDEQLFQRDKLLALQELSREIRKIEGVTSVESLFTANSIRGGEGWIDSTPLFRKIPRTDAEIAQRKALLLANPLMVGNIVSATGDALVLHVFLDAGAVGKEAGFSRRLHNQLQERIDASSGPFERIFQVGAQAMTASLENSISRDLMVVVPLASAALILTIGLMLRNVRGTLILILNTAMAIAVTLAFMNLMGIPLSLVNSMVPVLIVIIGCGEDIHFLQEYFDGLQGGNTPEQSIMRVGNTIGITLLLTGGTTFLGFISTAISDLPVMQEFGIVASAGMLIRLLFTLVLTPAWIRVLKPRVPLHDEAIRSAESAYTSASRESGFILSQFVERPRRTLFGIAAIALPCLILSKDVYVSNDLLEFLPPDSVVAVQVREVSRTLAGSKVIQVTLEGEKGEFRQAETLSTVLQLAQRLRKIEGVDSVISFSDVIGQVYQTFANLPTALIPPNDAALEQCLLFFSPDDYRRWLTPDWQATSLTLRTSIEDSTALNRLVHTIEAIFREDPFNDFKAHVTGRSVLVASAVDSIVWSQTASLSSVSVLLFAIVAILFLSPKTGLLAMLPNLFPAVVIFGLMALMKIPLNVGTCMVAAVTMGISVNDTLHMMTRYGMALKAMGIERKAIEIAIVSEFYPCLTTALSLAIGFGIMGFSEFVPIRQFGLLSALVMAVALISDLVMTPVLLTQIHLLTLWDAIGLKLREQLLCNSLFFAGMTSWEARRLILSAHVQDYRAGEFLIREGEEGNTLYVVIEGELEVLNLKTTPEQRLKLLQVGDVTGEVALVSRMHRTAHVRCLTPSRVLAMDWQSLENLQRKSPRLASRLFLNLARILGERLQQTNLMVTSGK